MKIFRIDGQPSRDDECEHGFKRFEKCARCLEADNARLRDALRKIKRCAYVDWTNSIYIKGKDDLHIREFIAGVLREKE